MRNVFKKEDFNQVSDKYYNSYREELKKREVKTKLFSLNNIIKVEFFTLVAGLVFMGYNNFFDNFSIEIEENFLSSILITQSNTLDKVEASVITVLQNREISIKEESMPEVEEQVVILSKKLNIDSTDMTFLVEIIKSQFKRPTINLLEDKIIISQL
jgi:hypothetical protein